MNINNYFEQKYTGYKWLTEEGTHDRVFAKLTKDGLKYYDAVARIVRNSDGKYYWQVYGFDFGGAELSKQYAVEMVIWCLKYHLKNKISIEDKMVDNKLIEVCNRCQTASCWYGEFMCDESKTAGTKLLTIRELKGLGLENVDNWDDKKLIAIYSSAEPHGFERKCKCGSDISRIGFDKEGHCRIGNIPLGNLCLHCSKEYLNKRKGETPL